MSLIFPRSGKVKESYMQYPVIVASTLLFAAFVIFVSIALVVSSLFDIEYDSNIIPSHIFANASEAPIEGAEEFVQDYELVEGDYVNGDLGFSFTIPNNMKGYLWESQQSSENENYYMTIQIHPEFNSTQESECCPSIDETPAVMLLDSGSMNSVSTPVPFTGDLYAAMQGYKMKMNVESLNGVDVLTATLNLDRRIDDSSETSTRIGKFYFMNSDAERFVSYGIWASEQGYQEYLDEFEESAKSLLVENAQAVNLESIFGQYFAEGPSIELADGSILHPKLITPSIIERVEVNQNTNTFTINVDEPNQSGFVIINSGELIAGPHTVTIDGAPAEGKILKSENGEFLVVAYDSGGSHEVAIVGSAIVPEFESSGMILLVVASGVAVIIFVNRKTWRWSQMDTGLSHR